MSLIVRDATAADIAAITAIYAHHVATGLGSFEETAPDAAEMARRRDDVRARGFPYLVAEDAGAILGFAYASPYMARIAYRYTVQDSIYIAPQATRRGVGRALLARLIALCEAKGYRQMIAIVGDSANAGSIGLHRSLGFATIGTLPAVGFKFGRWVDSVLMQRALGRGEHTAPDKESP